MTKDDNINSRKVVARIYGRNAASLLVMGLFCFAFQWSKNYQQVDLFTYSSLHVKVGWVFFVGAIVPISAYLLISNIVCMRVKNVRLYWHAVHIFSLTIVLLSATFMIVIVAASYSVIGVVFAPVHRIEFWGREYAGILYVFGWSFIVFAIALSCCLSRIVKKQDAISWLLKMAVILIFVISDCMVGIGRSSNGIETGFIGEAIKITVFVSPILYINIFFVGRMHRRWRLDYKADKPLYSTKSV